MRPPTRRRRPPNRNGTPPPRDPRPSDAPPHVVLVSAAVALYLATLWLGVAVIQDTPVRSAVMAGLIVAIAATGYLFTRTQGPR